MTKRQCLLCRRTLVTATAYCQGEKKKKRKEKTANTANKPNEQLIPLPLA